MFQFVMYSRETQAHLDVFREATCFSRLPYGSERRSCWVRSCLSLSFGELRVCERKEALLFGNFVNVCHGYEGKLISQNFPPAEFRKLYLGRVHGKNDLHHGVILRGFWSAIRRIILPFCWHFFLALVLSISLALPANFFDSSVSFFEELVC
jgi:hypothetical protein